MIERVLVYEGVTSWDANTTQREGEVQGDAAAVRLVAS